MVTGAGVVGLGKIWVMITCSCFQICELQSMAISATLTARPSQSAILIGYAAVRLSNFSQTVLIWPG